MNAANDRAIGCYFTFHVWNADDGVVVKYPPPFVALHFRAVVVEGCTWACCTVVYAAAALSAWRGSQVPLACSLREAEFLDEVEGIMRCASFTARTYSAVEKSLSWQFDLILSLSLNALSVTQHMQNWKSPRYWARWRGSWGFGSC